VYCNSTGLAGASLEVVPYYGLLSGQQFGGGIHVGCSDLVPPYNRCGTPADDISFTNQITVPANQHIDWHIQDVVLYVTDTSGGLDPWVQVPEDKLCSLGERQTYCPLPFIAYDPLDPDKDF
jgi:hypothetical protein